MVWSGCVYVATATGILCVIAKWGVPGAFVCAVLGAMSGAVVASSIWSDEEDGWKAVRKIGRLALRTGLLAPGVIGLIAALEFTGALIVLILAATAPASTAVVRARWFPAEKRRPRQENPPPPAPRAWPAVDETPRTRPSADETPWGRPAVDEPSAEPTSQLGLLDDEALCLAWRRSFVRLEAARSAAERLAVVEQRERYLDELQRRHPHGLAAWLASGARASGNPLPYVGEDDA